MPKEDEMKFEIGKTSIKIIPQDAEDEVYLESVLKLRKTGDQATVKRIAPYNFDSAWAYAEIRPSSIND